VTPVIAMTDERFKAELIATIPHLRAFANSIATRPEAEDLAQEAMLRAWKARASFQPGTNFKGWVFTILRNQFFSDKRRSWRTQPLDPEFAANTLVANDDPSAGEELLDVRNAMQHLPEDQREALVLVGAAGLSYEETAKICACKIGTVKSRVSRGRATLAAILEKRQSGSRAATDISSTQVFEALMQDVARLRSRLAPAAHKLKSNPPVARSA
jgi:RNA polymerase sigma-70 factor, ECF subfamily